MIWYSICEYAEQDSNQGRQPLRGAGGSLVAPQVKKKKRKKKKKKRSEES